MPAHKRIAGGIFVVLFVAYGYFHQGGGWNQNSRFDQVRAIVENHQLEINEYFLYQAQAGAAGPVKVVRLAGPKYVDVNSIPRFANTFDISVFAGKVYPNKPPGTVFLAVPAYWIIFQVESTLGVDPDAWWAQTLNFYLSTVFSVGIVTALGGVIFYLALLRLFPSLPDWVHVATTLTYGLGTLVFPFATLLFDHGLLATISLGAFWLLLVEGEGGFVVLSIEPFLFSCRYTLWFDYCRELFGDIDRRLLVFLRTMEREKQAELYRLWSGRLQFPALASTLVSFCLFR